MVRRLLLILILVLPLSAQEVSPIQWLTWGDAAFAKAKREKKPILLSVGYASSFDTFRMRREAMVTPENVKALNEWFVPVLLDRIEQPEIAAAYERVAASLARVEGWPANLVLTPDLEPYAAIGMADAGELQRFLVTNVNRWDGLKEKTVADAKAAIDAARPKAESPAPVDAEAIEAVVDAIAATYDAKHGGFGTAPKIPRPMTLSFLFRYAQRTKYAPLRDATVDTIRKMAVSAVHDQLGSGWHRGTHDDAWKQPVFEKMLHDQALMAMASLEAWQLTNDPTLADLTKATLDFAVRDMHAESGGFDASMDAFSLVPGKGPEHYNGAFYYWNRTELQHIFRDKAPRLYQLFAIADEGKSIPTMAAPQVLKEPDVGPIVQKMYEIRQTRPSPSREFTQILGLNALMISALARGGAALDERKYLSAATDTARYLTSRLWDAKNKKLWRSDAATRNRVEALAEDYALLIQGLLDLFEAGYDPKWLELALTLQQRQDALFWNDDAGRYTTGASVPAPLRGLTVDRDDGTPTANSVAAQNLLRLGALTGHASYTERAAAIFRAYGTAFRTRGGELTHLADVYLQSLTPAKQVVVSGDPRKKETFDLLLAVHQRYTPFRVVIFVPDKGIARERVERLLPWVKPMKSETGPLAWVCKAGDCQTTSDTGTLVKTLE